MRAAPRWFRRSRIPWRPGGGDPASRARAGAPFSPFAVRPHRAAGIYVLLPLPGFVGRFLLMAWLLLIWVFAAVETSPFIYFQFQGPRSLRPRSGRMVLKIAHQVIGFT